MTTPTRGRTLALLLLAGGFTLLDAGAWIGWYVAGKIVLGVVRW